MHACPTASRPCPRLRRNAALEERAAASIARAKEVVEGASQGPSRDQAADHTAITQLSHKSFNEPAAAVSLFHLTRYA